MHLKSLILALAVVAGFACLMLASGTVSVSADDHRNADVSFTKWVTDTNFPTFPWDMNGVVGADSGPGTFTGEVLSRLDNGTITTIHALYHVNGKQHSFTADLTVTEINTTHTAVLSGVVNEGWLKGNHVSGNYVTLASCDIATPGNILGATCFKGSLHVGRGSKN